MSLSTTPSWTRLSGEPIWEAAERAHARRFGRVYHDWARVLRLYERAELALRLPYDPALDLAILAHSAQIDLGGDRRARSVAWLRRHAAPGEPVELAARLILNGPYQDLTDPRLPLLELSDLADPATGPQAISDMISQICQVTRLPETEVRSGVMDEMNRIRRAIRLALPRLTREPDRLMAERILDGCEGMNRTALTGV